MKQNECNCQVIPGQKHKKDCAVFICPHCGGDKNIRNPKGYCDHLYYPEYCRVCNGEVKGVKLTLEEKKGWFGCLSFIVFFVASMLFFTWLTKSILVAFMITSAVGFIVYYFFLLSNA